MKDKKEVKEFKVENMSLVVNYTMTYITATDRYISEIKKVYLNINGVYTDITNSIKIWKPIWDVVTGRIK